MTKQYAGKVRDPIGLLREAAASLNPEMNVTLLADIHATISAAAEPACEHSHVVAIAGTQCMSCDEIWISSRREPM